MSHHRQTYETIAVAADQGHMDLMFVDEPMNLAAIRRFTDEHKSRFLYI
jgi:hypothetical protein